MTGKEDEAGTAVAVVEEEAPSPGPVESWRWEQLTRSGWDTESAFLVAIRREVDLHEAIELVRSGCSPELALRILL